MGILSKVCQPRIYERSSLAATKALEKCLQILEFFAPCQILLLTDSAYVLQVLEGGSVGFAHVSLQAGLVMLWHRCANKVVVRHVHAHKGHALNEIADRAAKEALEHPLSHYFMRRMDYTRAYMPVRRRARTSPRDLLVMPRVPYNSSVSP